MFNVINCFRTITTEIVMRYFHSKENPESETLRRLVERSETCRQLLQQCLHRLYWLAFPLEPASKAERGTVETGWTAFSIYPHPGSCPEMKLQCRSTRLKQTRGTTVTSYKSKADWRKFGRYGLSLTVGEIIASQWSATARLKLGSPQPVRCRPATVCLLHWVRGA